MKRFVTASSWRPIVVVMTLAVAACSARRAAPEVVPAADVPPARLSVTRLVAFGDSVTEGLLYGCPGTPAPASSIPADPPPAAGLRTTTPSGYSYPARLAALLHERYVGQPIEVVNEGAAGETFEQLTAELARVLVGDGPDALLLMAGSDVLMKGGADAQPAIVAGLQRMIRDARSRGVAVLVATLPPVVKDRCMAPADPDLPPADPDPSSAPAPETPGLLVPVILTNAAIRTMVGDEGATLVDVFEAFNGREASLLAPDGFHPNAAGYAIIARTVFEVVARTLEGG